MFAKMVAPYHVCTENPKLSCSSVAPAVESGTDRCYFRGNATGAECVDVHQRQGSLLEGGAAQMAGGKVCADQPGQLCAASSPDIQRLCACRVTRRHRRKQSRPSTVSTLSVSSSAAPPSRSSISSLGVAAAVAILVGSDHMYSGFRTTAAAFGIATIVLSAFPVSAHAHNWMMSPGRAVFQASTTKPCRSRKASDLHAQVGPGQTFIVEWATGHAKSPTGNSLIIVHNSDVEKLALANISKVMQEYLANAPKNSSSHMETQRYHGVRGPRTFEESRTFLTTKGHIYKAELSKDDPNWLEHTHVPTTALFSYQDDILKKDKRVSYHSEKYPWIEAVYTYMIVDNRATDWDGVRVSIPAKKGPGHYIVSWKFQGYYDCVDVEVFDDRQIEHVDGKLTDGHTWSKIDHCQYVGTRGITTPCMPAAGNSVQECIDAVTSQASSLARLGINVVPIQNPLGVAFPDQINIPWKDQTCANTAWTLVTKGSGAGDNSRIAENPLPDLKARLGTPILGMKCDDSRNEVRGRKFYNLGTKRRANKGVLDAIQLSFYPSTVKNSSHDNVKLSRLNLRQAMQACGIDPLCNHIEVRNLVRQNEDAYDDIVTGEHEFYGCHSLKSAGGTDSGTRTVWSRPEQYNPSVSYTDTWFNKNIATLTSWQISFHPDGSEEGDDGQALPEGWLADTGKQFATHKNGVKYGWKCDATKAVERGLYGQSTVYYPFDDERTILNTAWVRNVAQLTCPHEGDTNKKTKNVWQMEVPNGMYRVGLLMEMPNFGPRFDNSKLNVAGCMIHYTPASQRIVQNRGESGFTVWKNVEVSNKRLQLSGVTGRTLGCSAINTVMIYKISDNLFPPQWLPSSGAGGAWYQHEVPQGTRIGLVDIKFPRGTDGRLDKYKAVSADCRYNWMLGGDRCQHSGSGTFPDLTTNVPRFNGADQGFTVSVADSPCTADGCVGGTVCEVVNAPRVHVSSPVSSQDFDIDCNGAQGKYVRVHLPGANRIFSGTVYVNRVEPPDANPNQLACYGVVARMQTSTAPEYVTSVDPADPIFYSSCYVRERNMEWVTPQTPPPPPPPASSDFGTQCLDCTKYEENLALSNNNANTTKMPPPIWAFSEHCRTCSSGKDDAGTGSILTFENEEAHCPTIPSTTTSSSTQSVSGPPGVVTSTTTSDASGGNQTGTTAEEAGNADDDMDGRLKSRPGVGIAVAVLVCLTAAAVICAVYRNKLKASFSSGSNSSARLVGADSTYVNPVCDSDATDAGVTAAAGVGNTILASPMPAAGPQADISRDLPGRDAREENIRQQTNGGSGALLSAASGNVRSEKDNVSLLQHAYMDSYEI